MRKITDEFTRWTAVYLLCTKDQALVSLEQLPLQPTFRSAAVSSLGGPIRAVNTPAKTSRRIARRWASLNSLRLLTRDNKSAFRNALDGYCARWSGACVLTAGYRHFFGGDLMMNASYICRLSDSALLTKHGDAVQEALREARRPVPSQDHRRKRHRTHQNPKQARPHVVGRDGVRLQQDREPVLPHLEPKNASRGGEQERHFHRNTTKSASPARRLSP